MDIDITVIALISLGSFFGLLVLVQIQAVDWISKFRNQAVYWIYKWIGYTLVRRRLNGSSNMPVWILISLLALAGLNTFTLLFRATTANEISQRAARLFLINLIPVTLGDGSSFLTETLLGLHYRQLGVLHRWLWRVCFVNGLVHAFIQLRTSPLRWTLAEIIVRQ